MVVAKINDSEWATVTGRIETDYLYVDDVSFILVLFVV